MSDAFQPIRTELALWREAGRMLPMWWRDDDAVRPTPGLDRLLALAQNFGAPLHLAVIPEPAGADLAERLRPEARTFVLQHGWRHFNHAPPTDKKAEFGAHRPLAAMLEEIADGWRRLQPLFGLQLLPVFTPPWNRIAPALVESLAAAGFSAVSTYAPRRQKAGAPGLMQVNTHVDPIDWGSRGLLEPPLIAAQVARELADRRLGRADNAEPYGLLTHHLVHDEPIWAGTTALLDVFAESGVARWTGPLEESREPPLLPLREKVADPKRSEGADG